MTEINVRTRKKNTSNDPTMLSLLVESATEHTLEKYNKDSVANSLITELSMDLETANTLADEVTHKLRTFCETTGTKSITSSLIRALVNVVLMEKGHKEELQSVNDITIAQYDLTNIIEHANTENGNLVHSPESINFTLAERINKQYALKEVYSKDVAKAHGQNKIYVHDMGSFMRPYCSGHSPLYVLKNGIKNVPSILTTSAPAKSAKTLARHICSMTQFFSGMFSGAVGWEAVNVFFAPLLRGQTPEELKQLAQTLIFDLSQLAGAKGGQTSFTDFNIYLNIPYHYKECVAMGKGGRYMATDKFGVIKYYKTREEVLKEEEYGNVKALRYKDFEAESKAFARALFEVIGEGDTTGLPFPFPKLNMHIDEDTFQKIAYTDGLGYLAEVKGVKTYYPTYAELIEAMNNQELGVVPIRVENKDSIELLKSACNAASKTGCPNFIFDRDGASISMCCRLSSVLTKEDLKVIEESPENIRFVGVQNVSIILPNIPLEGGRTDKAKFYEELKRRMSIAMTAHFNRKQYIEKLLKLDNSPLEFFKRGMDGTPYINMDKGSYLIGMIGLNECVYNLIGKEMHESNNAYLLGLEIIAFMNMQCKELTKQTGLTVKLEETPGEGLTLRASAADDRKFGAKAFMHRNEHGTYYTNSVHFNYACDMPYMERLIKQSRFHPLITAGAVIHNWVGDVLPQEEAIYELAKATYYNTSCGQFTISGEFTKCKSCMQSTVGMYERCPKCESEDVLHMARVTGYYVVLEHFNKGKKAEHADRNRAAYQIK